MKDVNDYSFGDAETIACPYDYYKAMRSQDPVHFDKSVGSYIVSRYEDIMEAIKQPLLFSSQQGFAAQRRQAHAGEIDAFYESKGVPPFPIIVNSDPPYHTRIRSLMDMAFNAHRVATMETYITDIANMLIDRFIAQGRTDFIESFAIPLPIYVIADQLGIPRSKYLDFKRWSDATVMPLGRLVSKEQELWCAEQVVDMWHYVNQCIDERRENPTDDMISDLVHARIEGDDPTLSRIELFTIIRAFIVAGNETTTTAIGNGMLVLLKDPELAARMRANLRDDRLFSRLTEEILRSEAPVQGLPRVTTEDTELAGCPIPKGSLVLLNYASGNRDEAKFPDPEAFLLDRKNPGQHLAFGSGIHRCVGAMLSRMEIKVSMRLLLDRLDDLKLAIPEEELRYSPSMVVRPLISLPMTFTRRLQDQAPHHQA